MSYEQAMKEAYADSDIREVTIDTLEFRNPNFIDENGQNIAIRVVNAHQDYTFMLEQSAPMNGGQMVLFQYCPFNVILPKVEEGGAPELEIILDNVSREITKYLEMASVSVTPIATTYRPYIADEPEQVQMDPPFHMTITRVKVDVFQVRARATVSDVHNWPFPFEKYTPERFPGLVR